MAGPFAGMARIFLATQGTMATLHPAGGEDRQVTVIFRPRGSMAEIPLPGGDYALPVTSQQTLAMISPDEAVSENDRITINSQKYRIRAIEFDGGALNRLILVT